MTSGANTPAGKSAGRDPYAAFRQADFRHLISVWLLMSLTVRMQIVALGWDIYERTGSALAVGYVGLVLFVPTLLLFLPAGQLADRHDRRLLLVISCAITMLAALGLAWAAMSDAAPGWMYAAIGVGAVAQAINKPARSALLPSIVPVSLLANAVTWTTGAMQMASVVGPSLAGLLIATTGGAVTVYWAVVAINLIAVVLVLRIRHRERPGGNPGFALGDLLAGAVHMWKTPVILGAALLDLLVVLFSGANGLLPIYAKDILQVGPAGLGWLTAASAAGAIVMIFTLNCLPPSRRPGRRFLWAVAGFGLFTMLFGASTHFGLSLFALFVMGALNSISVVTRHTLVQSCTPVDLRGRVSSVNGVFTGSSNELGQFEAGAVASLSSPVIAVMSGGLATLVLVAVIARRFPELRNLNSLTQHKK